MSGTEKIIGEIIDINVTRDVRKNYVFRNSSVDVVTDEGDVLSFPCIGLYEKSSGLPLGYPRYERWYLPIEESIQKESETLRKRASNIVVFLNYVLHETRCNSLDELEQKHIRQFLIYFRKTKKGLSRNPKEWERGIRDVFLFLFRYAEYNKDTGHLFACNLRDLIKITVTESKELGRLVVYEPKLMGVKAPDVSMPKHRYLMEGYLPFVLMAAKAYDPMLVLAIGLQSYAGLREGEVVNVTRSSIKLQYGGFGRCSGVKINLKKNAPFFQKPSQGHIKKKREQDVYRDFVDKIVSYITAHELLLQKKGYDDGPEEPMFVNEWGKPLTAPAYCQRVKKLFYEHVIPAIRRMADLEGTWYLHDPFLEIWEDRVDYETGEIIKGDYPGAHCFRHWFTMYLVCNSGLSIEEIAKLRGDKNDQSIQKYIHVHADIIDLYRSVCKEFQESIIQEVI